MSLPSIPAEFFIFAATLIAIGIFHRHTLPAAASGLLAVVVYRLVLLGGAEWLRWIGSVAAHEWSTLANIVLVLLGFAVMANHFERNRSRALRSGARSSTRGAQDAPRCLHRKPSCVTAAHKSASPIPIFKKTALPFG